ncbi:MAG: hypothetical protein QMD21_03685 [Candidatus Thermoplasmatota archaeon]|nr:hypothetical protein [Candidatus Thermoplasmatota archaeon]
MSAMVWIEISSYSLNIIFHIFHSLHILLSAFVTTSMYKLHKGKSLASPLIGFVGSVGICSISDVALSYAGGILLGIETELHVCLIEHPHIIIFSALIGIALSYLRATTKCPHAAHVLVSTWASLFYLLAFGAANWLPLLPFIFVVLFIAVWLPCCVSDIVFPLSFVKELHLEQCTQNSIHQAAE